MIHMSLLTRYMWRSSGVISNGTFIFANYVNQSGANVFSMCCKQASLLVTARCFNVNRSVQTKWQIEQENAGRGRTDYDMDKQQWMKQMKFASMDCIIDPDITPIRYSSMAGLKRLVQRFVTMRKLKDRRPDFNEQQLKDIFCKLKKVSHDNSLDVVKQLQRLTTHGEATRLEKDIKTRINENFAKKSWKSLRQQTSLNTYEIEIDEFVLVNCYLGQMYEDDWVQITYKCAYRERQNSNEEWNKMLQYPVFEVHLTDGIRNIAKYPFIIVGVMKKDGTRYGKDTQNANDLRKQFSHRKS